MEEIKELTKAVYRIEAQQNEMSTVLSGNEKYGIPGIKDEIVYIKEQIQSIKDDRKAEAKRFFKWMGITAFGSSVITMASVKMGLGKALAIFLKLFGV